MRTKIICVVALALLGAPGTARAEEAGPAPAGEEAPVASAAETELSRELGEARQRIEELTARLERLEAASEARAAADEEDELEALRRDAEAAAAAEPEALDLSTETTFTGGERAQQALNPEISVAVDLGAALVMHDGEPESVVGIFEEHHHEEAGAEHDHGIGSGFFFRALELAIQSDLDPSSFTKIAIGFHSGEIHLCEAYATWAAVAPGLGLTLGRFRQQLGVVNRWHEESLDQLDYPLATTELLGADGLAQLGLSLDWLIPSAWEAASFQLTVQISQPENDHLFSGEYIEVPTALVRLQSYFDLTESLYFQLGLSGMWGMYTEDAADVAGDPVPAYDEDGNEILLYDEAGAEIGPLMVSPPAEHVDAFRGNVWIGAADLTLSWAPLHRERYQGVTFRSELYFVSQERREGRLQALGGYAYLDARVNETWVLGVRGDLTQPFELENADELRWQVVGYLTYWQSEWVRLRLQYSHAQGAGLPMDDMVALQVTFAAGPHRHERY